MVESSATTIPELEIEYVYGFRTNDCQQNL